MSLNRIILSFLLIISCLNLSAQKENLRPKIGLVLSGGGAKGFAHVGVLRVLEENNIPIDYIAGTSMGAIVGCFYAMGYSVDEIESMILSQDWITVLADMVDRKYIPIYDRDEYDRYAISFPIDESGVVLPRGIVAGQNIMKVFSRYTMPFHSVKDFSKFPIPFACVAADVVDGAEHVMYDGDIAIALRSSMAIPTLFTPVSLGDKLLVDGGMRNNLPVDVVNKMGADIIIAVDLQERIKTKEELTDVYSIFDQGLNYLGLDKYYENLKMVDYYIKPPLSEYNIMNFSKADTLIKIGYNSAKLLQPRWDSLRLSLGKYEYLKNDRQPVMYTDSLYVSDVTVSGIKNITEKTIFGKFNVKPKSKTTLGDIEEGVNRLYSSLGLRSAYYNFQGENNSIIHLDIEEKSNNRFNVGLHYDSWNNAALLLNTTFNNLLGKSSKFSLDLKLAENLAAAATYSYNRGWKPGIRLRFEATGFDFYEYNEDKISAQYGASAFRFDVNTNSIVSEAYSFGLGARTEYYILKNIIGSDELKKNNFFINYYAFLRMDTHETVFYPKNGMSLYAELRMVTDDGYNINNGNSFFMLYFKMKKPISICSNFTIIPTVYFNGALARHDGNVFAANTYWGGVVETSYFYNQIPFVGYKEMAVAYKNALVARLDLQLELSKNKYLILKWNVGKSSDFIDYSGFVHGLALTAAYNSPIGPLEISLMSNSVSKKLNYLVNLGYWF